jgi:hypothetical protein
LFKEGSIRYFLSKPEDIAMSLVAIALGIAAISTGLFTGLVLTMVFILSGAENFLESQVENTVTRENSIRDSNCCRFLIEADAGGGLRRGKGTKLGSGKL